MVFGEICAKREVGIDIKKYFGLSTYFDFKKISLNIDPMPYAYLY
jgi:hypothetical protein